jgi:phosphate transport system permease protein
MTEVAMTDVETIEEAGARRTSPRGAGFEIIFEGACFAAATALLAALGGVLISVTVGGWPALAKFGPAFLFTSTWDPVKEVFGAAGPIVDTLITSGLALFFALPVAGGVAVTVPVSVTVPLAVAVAVAAGVAVVVGVGVGLTGKRTWRCAWMSPPTPMSCAVTVTVWPAALRT